MSGHEEIVYGYAARKRRNEASKAWAKRDRQPWTEDDDDFLLEFWIDVPPSDRDEITVSQCLERTIESCRVRCEIIRKRLDIQCYSVTVTRTTVEYRGHFDDPEDQWWSPDYYKE